MVRITQELLRKRAEHNEGQLTSLEEVALHQENIEKLENLDVYCRHLQILLLQNNIIEKIENLQRLKELKYLNLALNNVSKIENLEGCENLEKLDLTANFIEAENFEESLYNLKKVSSIRELFLMGNPCTDWKDSRELTIAIVDQLKVLDGKEIQKSERIIAKQKFDELMDGLEQFIKEEKIKNKDKQNNPESYTKDNRRKMYEEIAEENEKRDREKNPQKYQKKELSQEVFPNGEIRQCNEGKYDFKLDEWDDPDYSMFEIKLPRFLDTSLIKVEINPKYISIRVKEKLTQMKLFEEIIVENSTIQRSQITGILQIKMKKLTPTYILSKKKQEEKPKEQIKNVKQIEQQKEISSQNLNSNGTEMIEEKKVDYTLDDVPDLE